jgi:hypothetical protein
MSEVQADVPGVLGRTWVVPWCMQGLLSLVLPVQASLGAIFAAANPDNRPDPSPQIYLSHQQPIYNSTNSCSKLAIFTSL